MLLREFHYSPVDIPDFDGASSSDILVHAAIILGIFDKRMNKEGALSGMIVGVIFTTIYIFYFKPQLGGPGLPQDYLFGISPEGIGTIGMIINFIVSLIVSRLTKPTPENIKELVESIRYPK